MKIAAMKMFILTVVCAATVLSAQAQTLVDVWSFEGGGLDPVTYGGNFRPATLNPDAGSAPGAGITYTGMTSGGLGSSTVPEGYGGIYTNNSSSVAFTLQTTNVLSNIETITVSFLSGGLTTFSETSLTLNYNLGNVGVASSSYLPPVLIGPVETPIGPVPMTLYTWTWDVSEFGLSTGFSLNWSSGVHTFVGDINMTQAVPEPSTYVLIGVGLGIMLVLRKRSRKSAVSSI